MRQRTDVFGVICGQAAVKFENKLDGTRGAYCAKYQTAPTDTLLHEVLRRIHLKQAAKRFLYRALTRPRN